MTDEFKNLVSSADLSDGDKAIWLEALPQQSPEVIRALINYIDSDRGKLFEMTENIRQKKFLLEQNKLGELQDLVNKEQS